MAGSGLRAAVLRRFHIGAAATMLLFTAIGFAPFYLRGHGQGERIIDPELLPLVTVHGAALTAWMIVLVLQPALIARQSRRWHVTLGWWSTAIAATVGVSGFLVAVESVRPVPTVPFWGMEYRQFLLVMLAEIAAFSGFVIAGVLNRKRPPRHRAMMLLAGLSILAGATVRMPILYPLFGTAGWHGIFGPTFALGGLFVLIRSLAQRRLDRWLAGGYAALVVSFVLAVELATTQWWSELATALL